MLNLHRRTHSGLRKPTATVDAGNDITSCVNGATVKITCADYGLTTCGVATTFPICM